MSNNIIQDHNYFGIYLSDDSNATLQNNTIQKNGFSGIGTNKRAQGTFKGNTITGNALGIRIDFDTLNTPPVTINIEDNTIKDNFSYGIIIFKGRVDITSNIIDGNDKNGETPTGVKFLSGSSGSVQSNTISNHKCGISGTGDASVTIGNNTFSGNDKNICP